MASEMKQVKMQDGRTVGFGKAQKVRKSVIYDGETPTIIRFDGRNGQTASYPINEIPQEIAQYAVVHGLLQKLGDEYADLDTPEECFLAVEALFHRLMTGSWDSPTREGDGGILVQALVAAFGVSSGVAREQLKTLTAKETRQLRGIPEIADAIRAIETERTQDVDTDALKAKFTA